VIQALIEDKYDPEVSKIQSRYYINYRKYSDIMSKLDSLELTSISLREYYRDSVIRVSGPLVPFKPFFQPEYMTSRSISYGTINRYTNEKLNLYRAWYTSQCALIDIGDAKKEIEFLITPEGLKYCKYLSAVY
jgi:hypothetical protein